MKRPGFLTGIEASNRLSVVTLFLPIAACLGIAFLLWFEVKDRRDWVDHTSQVIFQIDSLKEALSQAESAKRGLMLTGDKIFRAPYDDARARASDGAEQLRRLVQDNAQQSARASRLVSAVQARLATLDEQLALIDRGDMKSAMEIMRSSGGPKLMGAALEIANDIAQEETRLLRQWQKSAIRLRWFALVATGVLGFLGFFVVGLSLRLAQQEAIRRHGAEAALRESEMRARHAAMEAEQANAAKSDFLASMSHELRTPLNAVSGFAQLLLVDKQPLSPTQRHHVGYIVRAGHQLLALIDDVLDLARIESGRVAFSIETVDLLSVLEEFAAMLAPIARKKGLVFSFDRPPHKLGTVRADRTRLLQILLNLGSNAVKYNREGGWIRVNVENTPLGRVLIGVADSGIGIPRERQPHVFEAFNRLGLERSEIEGTGIGLSIARKLAALMGGTIGFESTPGQGSRFWIDLPEGIAATKVEAPGQAPQPAPATASEAVSGAAGQFTVLYIEDNPTSVALMRSIVAAVPGSRFLTTATGKLGFELAMSHRPDLVILDIHLPDITGYDVLQRLKDHPETSAIPVLAISADALPKDIQRAKAAGFADYMTKPFVVTEMLQAIRSATHHTIH